MYHRPHQIQDHHLDRLAVVCRQEVHPQEVAEPSGSPASPSHERELVIRWGWPEKTILVIEETQNASSSGADSSDGFKRLCELVAQKQVGIIMMPVTSSLPQSGSDLLNLRGLCQATDTLIAINGAIVNLDRRTNDLFADIRAIVVKEENQWRTERTVRAKRYHATSGRAVSRPPTGYIVTGKGQWGKDVLAVQERIKDVFRLYDSLGSVGKVVQFLVAKGLEMPLRTQTGQLHWVRPTYSRIYTILTNPAFAGWYVYGRHATVQSLLHRRQRKTTWEQRIVVPDHHEPYITIEEWHRINSRLRAMCPPRQQTGNGAAA